MTKEDGKQQVVKKIHSPIKYKEIKSWRAFVISIYSYTCPVNYLRDYFNFKQSTDENFSLTKWSKQAGLSGPFAIVDILKNKKKLKTSMASSLVHHIGLDASEFTYFIALVAKSQSDVDEVQKMYDLLLNDLKPSHAQNFNDARFKDGDLFSHWILTTILGATKLKNAKVDAKGLKSILREEVSEEIINLGLQYLMDQGLITLQNGKLERTYDRVSTHTDVKHSNVNNYFFQMADMAKKAVDLPLEIREFQSFNMTITKQQLPLIKEIIRKCRTNLSALCVDEAEEVYQMNMFLFPLTNTESDKNNSEMVRQNPSYI